MDIYSLPEKNVALKPQKIIVYILASGWMSNLIYRNNLALNEPGLSYLKLSGWFWGTSSISAFL